MSKVTALVTVVVLPAASVCARDMFLTASPEVKVIVKLYADEVQVALAGADTPEPDTVMDKPVSQAPLTVREVELT